jgi:hypothetical protein
LSCKRGKDLRVGREANADNLANLAEELVDSVLVNVERQVTDEEGVALGADAVTVALGTVGSTSLGSGLGGTGVGVVKVEGTALKVLALHGIVGLGARLGISEVDIAEALAAAGVLVPDNTSADETLEVLEGLVEGVVIDAPAQAASEQSSRCVSLGLLGAGVVLIILSLALLGYLRGSLLLRLLGVVAAVIRIVLGVVRVLVGGSFLLDIRDN